LLLAAERVSRSIGDRRLFGGVDFALEPGDRLALVGPNGAGKSTLLRVLAGEDPPDDGRVHRARGARVLRLRQEVDPRRGVSVREEAAAALSHLDALETELRDLEAAMARCGGEVPADLAERYDRAHHAFEQGGGFSREARVDAVLSGLGFDEASRDRPLEAFSGGWLVRVELARLLLAGPDVLLLDEPTNHLDLPAIQWLEDTLAEAEGALVLVSHDRAFLRRHARCVGELDGQGGFAFYRGSYDDYLHQRAERREQLLARQRQQEREVERVERFVERFRAKATKARQVQSRVKALEKLERVEVEPERRRRPRLRIPAPPRAGEVVLRLEQVHKRYEAPVFEGVELELRRGDKLALLGPNGAGKSTLLRLAAGRLAPDAGHRRLGHNVRAAWYAQHQIETLEPSNTVLEELGRAARTEDVPRLRGHLGAFLFSGDDVDKQVSVLSGGEKARLALAKLLLRPANLLILDEPTNHLDIEACEVLERALAEYEGTLLLVSHDRAFLEAVATRLVEVGPRELVDRHGPVDAVLRALRAAEGPGQAPAEAPEAPAPAADPRADRRRERDRRKARDRVAKRLERAEQAILEREKEVETTGWELAEPELWRDPERRQALEARRAELREELAGRYAEWEELAEELEELGGE